MYCNLVVVHGLGRRCEVNEPPPVTKVVIRINHRFLEYMAPARVGCVVTSEEHERRHGREDWHPFWSTRDTSGKRYTHCVREKQILA